MASGIESLHQINAVDPGNHQVVVDGKGGRRVILGIGPHGQAKVLIGAAGTSS
jgi:hypothetical protein